MFGNAFASPFIVPVVAIICWAVITITRIKTGTERGWRQHPRNTHVPPMFEKMLEKAMEERDAEIKGLKERVEVLEKIVTDTHASMSLATEIDKLRDAK
jgi:predicted transcriptional regulator